MTFGFSQLSVFTSWLDSSDVAISHSPAFFPRHNQNKEKYPQFPKRKFLLSTFKSTFNSPLNHGQSCVDILCEASRDLKACKM